jgi:twitching motility protein PilT
MTNVHIRSKADELFDVIDEAIRVSRNGPYSASTSDLHIEGNEPPWHRIDGAMHRMDLPAADPDAIRAFCETYLSKREYDRLSGQHGAADGAIAHPGLGGIRIHAFRAENGLALALRLLREGVPDLASLGLPAVVSTFADFATGLVLFTGPTGSGKTTALAALIEKINSTYPRNIVTIEDPVEHTHRWLRSVVTQYEVGRDVSSYAEGVRGALRADPDVIFIGELRGIESVTACLQAAETGHVVFAALHTPSESAQAIHRLVGLFSGPDQESARLRLADALRGIVGLRLLPRRDGSGLRAAAEIVITNDAVRRLIRDGSLHNMRGVVASGRREGMQTLESHLNELVANGDVDIVEARAASLFPGEIVETQTTGYRRRS